MNTDGYIGVIVSNEKSMVSLGMKDDRVVLMKTGKKKATFYGDLEVVGKFSSAAASKPSASSSRVSEPWYLFLFAWLLVCELFPFTLA